MGGLARRLAPAAALGGIAIVIVGVADPAIAGRTLAPSEQRATGSEQALPGSTRASATCDTVGAVAGPGVMTPWGAVQVAATIADGQVCEVHAVAWPSRDRRSSNINAYAIPQLDAMASQAGTAFDTVSGATYTSEAYRGSLQSLLDSM